MHKTQQALSDIVVYNKYARYIPEKKRRETWDEIVDRYVEMMIKKYGTKQDVQCWKEFGRSSHIQSKYQISDIATQIVANATYLYYKRVLMSMRAAQFAGPAIEKNESRMYNCGYLPMSDFRAFGEIMFLLLGGTGVGFSVQKNHVNKLPEIRKPLRSRKFLISDSIEGWADAVKTLMKAYFGITRTKPRFDFSDIRPKGSRLVTAGGKAPGPAPLKRCLFMIEQILDDKQDGEKLKTIEVHDIVCHIADAVLAGGIRRAALISLFSVDDMEMRACKHGKWWELNPQRGRANNSGVFVRGRATKEHFMDYWKQVQESNSGEPGIYWTNDPEYGTNPCCEISLRPFTFCNLTEINAGVLFRYADMTHDPDDLVDNAIDCFYECCRVAAFFGTLQAGFTDFHYLREEWQHNTEKDALIGVGITGICNGEILTLHYAHENLLMEGAKIVRKENERVAKLIGINKASRCTTIKPSGCRPATSDSLVTTEEGIFTLPELFKDHKGEGFSEFKDNLTVSVNGNKLSKTFYNGAKPVYEIELEGQIQLKSTGNHPWYVTKNYNRNLKNKYTNIESFKSTEHLQQGDILDVNLGIYQGTVSNLEPINLFPYKMTNANIEIKFPEQMSSDLAWLIGYIDGDGSIDPLKGRFRFIDENEYNLERVKTIFKDLFNLDCTIVKLEDRNAFSLEKASIILYRWFVKNNLITKYDDYQTISKTVRTSTKNHILCYFAGLIDSDGCVRNVDDKIGFTIAQKEKPVTRHWQQVALCVGIHLNHSLNKARNNSHSKSNMILLSNTGFSQHNSMLILKKFSNKLSRTKGLLHSDLNSKPNQILGKVKSVKLIGNMPTYDVEVEKAHWFYAGAIKSHNTTSCVVGTSSGIHAWHSKYYIRNIQCKVGDELYNYFAKYHPELIKIMEYDPNSAVIGIPQKAPHKAKMRTESAVEMLQRIELFNREWVRSGHRGGPNTNNVSATVSIRDNEQYHPDTDCGMKTTFQFTDGRSYITEWQIVGEWMWENRNRYNGLSVLPYDGGTYKNAPFEECTEEEYLRLLPLLDDIDLTKIIEEEDHTDLSGEIACGPDGCEII